MWKTYEWLFLYISSLNSCVHERSSYDFYVIVFLMYLLLHTTVGITVYGIAIVIIRSRYATYGIQILHKKLL